MSLVFVRSFLSVALLSSYGSTAPLDYKDPQTWFQADELMSSPNQTDSSSSAAFDVVVSPSVIPTYGPTTSPQPPPVPTITTMTPTIKTTVAPLTKITTTLSPATVTSTSTLKITVKVDEPIVITSMRPTLTSTLSPQDRSTIVSSSNPEVPTSTSIASSQDKSPIISSANSVVVHCSPNAGTASVSAVTGNERTSAVVQSEGTFTTAAPMQIRLTPPLRRTTTLPTIVLRNRSSNRKRTNNESSNGRNREACDMCTSFCSGNRQICARPEGVDDPDQLRGFPSVCHMDCFNVCRKIRYEKVADGRCGRLRDGIRPLGSKKKLTKIELNKTQYQVADGDDTIFVF